MSKKLTAEQKAANKAKRDAKLGGAETKVSKKESVTVRFEGGQERTYTGKDAQVNAESFVSKRPAGVRKIV